MRAAGARRCDIMKSRRSKSAARGPSRPSVTLRTSGELGGNRGSALSMLRQHAQGSSVSPHVAFSGTGRSKACPSGIPPFCASRGWFVGPPRLAVETSRSLYGRCVPQNHGRAAAPLGGGGSERSATAMEGLLWHCGAAGTTATRFAGAEDEVHGSPVYHGRISLETGLADRLRSGDGGLRKSRSIGYLQVG